MKSTSGISRVNASALVALLSLASIPVGANGQRQEKKSEPFISHQGGWTAEFPASWRIYPSPTDNNTALDIINFPLSRRVTAVFLPEKGAEISVGPPPEGISTIAEWIKRRSVAQDVQSRQSFILRKRDSQELLKVTEVISQAAEGLEVLDCYFEFAGHPMLGSAVYWKGDPNAPKLRALLHEIIATIRPLNREPGTRPR